MHLQLNIDTENITDADRGFLRALAGDAVFTVLEDLVEAAQAPAPTLSVVPDTEPVPAAEDKPKRARRTKAQMAADEAAAAAEDGTDEADLPGIAAETEAAASDEVTLEDAVAAASRLLSTKRGEEVKAALDQFGAARVSELKPRDYAAFVAALPA